jgi:hypothetical protein
MPAGMLTGPPDTQQLTAHPVAHCSLQAILEAVDNGGGVANTRAAGVVGSNMAWAAGEPPKRGSTG